MLQHELEEIIEEARGGNAVAQCELGNIYCRGQLGEINYEEGRIWYLRAAEQGNSTAMGNLGLIYYKGYGVESDKKKAFQYFLEAAECGNILAMRQVANMYEEGCGIEQNVRETKFWRFRAESQSMYEENYEIIQRTLREGQKLFDENKFNEAEEKYINVQQMIPSPQMVYKETAEVFIALGKIYEKRQEYILALRVYQDAAEVYMLKSKSYIYYLMGRCFYKSGNIDEATKYLKMLCKNDINKFCEKGDEKYIELLN